MRLSARRASDGIAGILAKRPPNWIFPRSHQNERLAPCLLPTGTLYEKEPELSNLLNTLPAISSSCQLMHAEHKDTVAAVADLLGAQVRVESDGRSSARLRLLVGSRRYFLILPFSRGVSCGATLSFR